MPGALKRVKQLGPVRWLAKEAIHATDSLAIRAKRPRIEDTIVIVGSPRSGTTLVMELLGWLPGYTTLFEPLHPVWFPDAARAGFGQKGYAPPGQDWPEGEAFLRRVFSGQVVGRHLYFNAKLDNVVQRFRARRLVVKFVRANQVLPWMHGRFPVRATLFTFRHPCAVINSQFKTKFTGYLKGEWDHFPTAQELATETSRLEPEFPGVMKRIEGLEAREEILAAIWCLDTMLPLHSPHLKDWYVLPYERLLTDKSEELERIFRWLGEPVPEKAIAQLGRPTQVTQEANAAAVTDSSRQLPKWREKLDPEVIRRILRVLERFEIDFYTDDPAPHLDRLDRYVEQAGRASSR